MMEYRNDHEGAVRPQVAHQAKLRGTVVKPRSRDIDRAKGLRMLIGGRQVVYAMRLPDGTRLGLRARPRFWGRALALRLLRHLARRAEPGAGLRAEARVRSGTKYTGPSSRPPVAGTVPDLTRKRSVEEAHRSMGKKSKSAPLTTEQADALQLYIWDIRNRLNLSHWDTFLAEEGAEKDVNASVHPVPGRWVAGIRICRNWLELSEAEKRNTIVHELLHLVHRDQTEVIRCGLQDSGYVPGKAFTMMWRSFELHTEAMVDHLAGVLAPPTPPAP